MASEISAKRVAYPARRECLLLSDAGAGDGRANFGDARTGGRLEENVRCKAELGIDELSQVFAIPQMGLTSDICSCEHSPSASRFVIIETIWINR